MAEWTSEKREQMYRYLAEGKLQDAIELVAPLTALKQSDFSPKDQKAIQSFENRLLESQQLQQELMEAIIHSSSVVNRLGLFCFKAIKNYPSESFITTFNQQMALFSEQVDAHSESMKTMLRAFLSNNEVPEDKIEANLRDWEPQESHLYQLPQCPAIRKLLNVAGMTPTDGVNNALKPYHKHLSGVFYTYYKKYQERREAFLSKQEKRQQNKLSTHTAQEKEITMAEWTSEKRKQMYRYLAEGKLQDAIKLVKPMTALKQNDFAPKDKKAMESFINMTLNNPSLQTEIIHSLSHSSTVVVKLTKYLLRSFTEFPPEAFVWAFNIESSLDSVAMNPGSVRSNIENFLREQGLPEVEVVNFLKNRKSQSRVFHRPEYVRELVKALSIFPTGDIDQAIMPYKDFLSTVAPVEFSRYGKNKSKYLDKTKKVSKTATVSKLTSKLPITEAASVYLIDKCIVHTQLQERLKYYSERYESGEISLNQYFSEWVEVEGCYAPAEQAFFMPFYTKDPELIPFIASRVIECARDQKYPNHEWGAQMICQYPDLVRAQGEDCLELLSLGLWRTKSAEIRDTIFRIHYFTEQNHCTPQEAIDTIAQVFDSDQSAAWNHAARSIKDLLKMDKDAVITCTDRLNEIIEIDSKYQKTFAPLLKRTEN